MPPTFNQTGTAVYVRCWFPSRNEYIKVDIIEIMELADDFETLAFLSYIHTNLYDVMQIDKVSNKGNLAKFARTAGFNPLKRTGIQKQLKASL
jgi:hypothetical protein